LKKKKGVHTESLNKKEEIGDDGKGSKGGISNKERGKQRLLRSAVDGVREGQGQGGAHEKPVTMQRVHQEANGFLGTSGRWHEWKGIRISRTDTVGLVATHVQEKGEMKRRQDF